MTTRSYTKLFASIITSSMWSESPEVRVVWVTMLALADRYSEVHASIPGLARAANVSVDVCERALQTFLSPDPYSRTTTDEGRRVAAIDGGWRLINGPKYRDLMSVDERREYKRVKEQERRDRTKDERGQPVDKSWTNVDNGGQIVDKRGRVAPEAEAEVQEKAQAQTHTPRVSVSARVEHPSEPSLSGALWERWCDYAARHGAKQPLVAGPGNFEHLRVLAASYAPEELDRAMLAWWASPFTGGRNLGMFRSQVGEVLEHLARGDGSTFRAPRSMGPSPTEKAEQERVDLQALAARLAARKGMR